MWIVDARAHRLDMLACAKQWKYGCMNERGTHFKLRSPTATWSISFCTSVSTMYPLMPIRIDAEACAEQTLFASISMDEQLKISWTHTHIAHSRSLIHLSNQNIFFFLFSSAFFLPLPLTPFRRPHANFRLPFCMLILFFPITICSASEERQRRPRNLKYEFRKIDRSWPQSAMYARASHPYVYRCLLGTAFYNI